MNSRWSKRVFLSIVAFILIALAFPAPDWFETSSQSCHLCGAKRWQKIEYRWWQRDHEEAAVIHVQEVTDSHQHDWWEFSRTKQTCFGGGMAADKPFPYRDGRFRWMPYTESDPAGDAEVDQLD